MLAGSPASAVSDLLSQGEGAPQRGADAVVDLIAGREDDRQNLLDVRHPAGIPHRFVGLEVQDLADKLGVQTQLEDMDHLAVQQQRELLGVGGIDKVAADRGETRGGELVGVA
jgi:hypothetical protein